MFYFRYQTSVGPVGIAEESGFITNLWFLNPGGSNLRGDGDLPQNFMSRAFGNVDGQEKETPLLIDASRQLSLYLKNKLNAFDLPLSPRGTDFMRGVWSELQNIPYGETASYSDIAQAIGNSKAVRAVGLANNRNPIAIIIPCHRVIGKNGSLTGYAGGLDLKGRLLELEKTGYLPPNR